MRSVQKMLDHFQMPEELQQRVKTFLLFKRYHSITQEGLLVRCLPPSLLTDIRLVHLRPMIEKVEFLRGMEGSITRMLVHAGFNLPWGIYLQFRRIWQRHVLYLRWSLGYSSPCTDSKSLQRSV
ncbi:hypothetical protein GN244_ATG20165 [Phytophthora infestans]|uniref:Uncharacterized protein n=1 Tax=Phytophthora infestans TaxID=4787 RepID=A0A833SDL1_PHYIN|nr:hypothetical protein GN244_ATG20165 [Phytophthora infestans]KAF4132434.1 hypothetical protein GN958_ATG18404 [Phytophthora infestans]